MGSKIYKVKKDFAGLKQGQIIKPEFEGDGFNFYVDTIYNYNKIHKDIVDLHPEIFNDDFYSENEKLMLEEIDIDKPTVLKFMKWLWPNSEEKYNEWVVNFRPQITLS